VLLQEVQLQCLIGPSRGMKIRWLALGREGERGLLNAKQLTFWTSQGVSFAWTLDLKLTVWIQTGQDTESGGVW